MVDKLNVKDIEASESLISKVLSNGDFRKLQGRLKEIDTTVKSMSKLDSNYGRSLEKLEKMSDKIQELSESSGSGIEHLSNSIEGIAKPEMMKDFKKGLGKLVKVKDKIKDISDASGEGIEQLSNSLDNISDTKKIGKFSKGIKKLDGLTGEISSLNSLSNMLSVSDGFSNLQDYIQSFNETDIKKFTEGITLLSSLGTNGGLLQQNTSENALSDINSLEEQQQRTKLLGKTDVIISETRQNQTMLRQIRDDVVMSIESLGKGGETPTTVVGKSRSESESSGFSLLSPTMLSVLGGTIFTGLGAWLGSEFPGLMKGLKYVSGVSRSIGKYGDDLLKWFPRLENLIQPLIKFGDDALKWGSKIGKGLVTAFQNIPILGSLFKVGGDVLMKSGAKAGAKAGVKVGGKFLGKILKPLLKKIPLVGLGAGMYFAYEKFMDGDKLGAAMELASGIASLVPGPGTIISALLDAGILARDVTMNEEEKKTQGIKDVGKSILGFVLEPYKKFKPNLISAYEYLKNDQYLNAAISVGKLAATVIPPPAGSLINWGLSKIDGEESAKPKKTTLGVNKQPSKGEVTTPKRSADIILEETMNKYEGSDSQMTTKYNAGSSSKNVESKSTDSSIMESLSQKIDMLSQLVIGSNQNGPSSEMVSSTPGINAGYELYHQYMGNG